MMQSPTSSPDQTSFKSAILRIVLMAVVSALLIYALISIGIAITVTISQQREVHTNVLTQVSTTLSTEMSAYLREANAQAVSSDLRQYLSLQEDRPDITRQTGSMLAYPLSRIDELIRVNSTDYLAARFISIENENIPLVTVNRNGIPVHPPLTNTGIPLRILDDPAYQAVATRSVDHAVVSDFRLQVDEQGVKVQPERLVFSIYVPVYSIFGNFSGVLEVVINANRLLNIVNDSTGNLFEERSGRHLVLLDNEQRIVADSQTPASTYLESFDAVEGNAVINPVFEEAARVSATAGDERLEQITTTHRITTLPVAAHSAYDWQLVFVDNLLSTYTGIISMISLFIGLVVVLAIFAYYLTGRYVERVVEPVAHADRLLRQFIGGSQPAIPARDDAASSELEVAIQNVTTRITGLQERLAQQTRQHNRDLQIAGRIGRETATMRDLDDLLRRAINTICNELGFYHAQVFLIDESRTQAVLRYSRGEAGQKMLAQGHTREVGSASVIGLVTGKGEAVVVNDAEQAQAEGRHGFNPLLPDTRAELGLPLFIGGEIIGALDIQSKEVNAFHEEDIPLFQLVADQLAIAIHNARLQEQADRRIQQIDRLNRQLTRSAWQEAGRQDRLPELYGTSPPPEPDPDSERYLSAPISIRGELIGSLDVAPGDNQTFTEGDRAVLSAVADRVALAIENARLFQQTQSSLTETSMLYQLSQELNEADVLEDVLQAIIDAVAPDATGGQIWLFDDYMPGETPDRAHLVADFSLTTPLSRVDNPIDIDNETLELSVWQETFLQHLTGSSTTFVGDIQQEPTLNNNLRAVFEDHQARAVAFIPLNMRGIWKGFITLNFSEARDFSERDTRIYNAIIGQAGVTIDNRLLLRQTEEALSRNEKLYAASRIVNTAQNFEDLVYAAVATASDPGLEFWLSLLEGEADAKGWTNQSRIIAQSRMGIVENTSIVHEIFIPDDSPMRQRDPEILVDPGEGVEDVSMPVRWMRSMGYQFMAIFPLFSDNMPIALFYIVSEMPYDLTNEDYDVYRALTGQMSTQIQNRRLLEQTEEALNEARRLFVATRAVTAAREMDGIYQAVATHLAITFQNTTHKNLRMSITIFQARPHPLVDAPELACIYQWSDDPDQQPDIAQGASILHEAAPFGDLLEAEADDVLVFHDIENEVRHDGLREILSQHGATTAVIAALRSREKWYGVLICRGDQAGLFDESYARYMQAIASQVAIAMERQELLADTERERRNLNDILSTLPAGVLVLDPETFIPVQWNNAVEALLGREIILDEPFTADTYDLYRTGTHLNYPDEELPTYLARAENTHKTQDDVAVIHEDDNYSTDLQMSAAPIYDADGTITAIVVAFLDISNLRSLENTLQEQLRESVALYEAQRSIIEADTLDELLDAILMQLMLQQPDDAWIILYDDETESLNLVRHLVQPLNPISAMRAVLPKLGVERIDDVEAADMPEMAQNLLLNSGVCSMMLLPMQARSREMPLGWLVVAASVPHQFTIEQERTLISLNDMATTAVDNRYLVQRTEKALQETDAVYRATRSISRAFSFEDLSAALQEAMLSLEADMYAAYLDLRMEGGALQELFCVGFEDSIENGLDMETLATARLPDRDNLYIADINRTTLGELEMELLQSGNVTSFAAVNLRVKDMPGGRLLLGYREAHEFTDTEHRILGSLVDSASVVLDNQLLLAQIQNTLQETSVLYQASRALIEVNTPEEIIDVIVNYVIEPHINQVFIALLTTGDWQAAGATVEVVASWQSESDVDLLGVTLSPEQFPAWRQLATESVLTINDIYDESADLDFMEQTSIESLDTRSLVIIPLRVAGRALGAIWLGSREPYNYTDDRLRIFQAFAEQTSLSLEAARLLEQTERRARQLQTSSAISQSVGQILDLDVLLPQVVDLIKQQFGYDQVQIFLMDEENDWALLHASTGESGRQLLAIGHKLQRGSDSVIGQVTARGEPTIALDTADASVIHQPNPYLPLTRSEMALPLILKQQVVGALDVQSNQPNAFEEEDIQALTTLAAQISVAIDNARLYEDVQSRASEMSFLFDLTTETAAAETVDDALRILANRLTENMDARAVVIYLPTVYADYRDNKFTRLKAAAIAGDVAYDLADMPELLVGDTDTLIGLASDVLRTINVDIISDETPYIPVSEDARSAILVPISSGGELIGFITMESTRTEAYSNNIALMQALAGSVAAVIQNTLLVEQLQSSNEQLREIDRLKSQFLASMSHELRTPLNSIIGFSRVMLKGIDGPLTEMQEQDLNTIYESGNHLLNLVNDILDQAKIQANKLDLKFDYFEIKSMIESVKSIAIGYMKTKEEPLDLEVEIARNLPRAYGDEFRTRQIIINLVSNAIKFTSQGSVTIRAYSVQAEDSGDVMIQVDVSDTGIGIAEKDLPILFEEFRQIDNSLTRTVGGTGLGLPISRSLAELQGGELAVESIVNTGSTFSLVIPTKPGAEKELEQKQREQSEKSEAHATGTLSSVGETDTRPPQDSNGNGSTAPAKSKRSIQTQNMPAIPVKREILLIEDNKEMVDQFRRVLQREGFEVQTADMPAYARAMVGTLRPTLVVLDVNFSEGEGWHILKDLKEKDDTFDIPIIVHTINNDSERAYRLGAHTVIQRPALPDDLVEAALEAEKESQRERILIIDDQPEDIRLLTQLLGEHGNFRVFSAENGQDGISMVARRRPDLIILDLRMPQMDGFAVLEELRANPETAHIPVMIVTGEIDLNASEQQRLENIYVLPKTDISREEFETFINNVKNHLTPGESHNDAD